MPSVEIEYCVPCGFRQRAVDVAESILEETEGELEELDLVMGDHGVFRVTVDGETVYDKDEGVGDGSDVASAVRAAI